MLPQGHDSSNFETNYCSRSTPSSSIQQISHARTWKTPTSMRGNASGRNCFQFTQQPSNGMWNTSSTDLICDDTDTQENEEVIDDTASGKNFDAFETKLQEGFLEATGLNLICAPPAMFDYQPPLHRIDLKDNKIELLPEHFFDELPKLSWCDLRYNRLQTLAPLTKEHRNLKVLLLQDNQLSDLPCSLGYAINLKNLGWTNNYIVEPPQNILLQGCAGILKYLQNVLTQRIPFDEYGNPVELPNDQELKKDLENLKKRGRRKKSASRNSVASGFSSKSQATAEAEKVKQQKRIDRIKYTWGLWKDVPYQGVSSQSLFEKSVKEMKDEVNSKINGKKNYILQKIKDCEAVAKWRKEAKVMQMQGPSKPYNGVDAPFGTDKDRRSPRASGAMTMTPESFRSTLTDCLKKLQTFTETPTALTDTEASMERLKEVEEIQRKLSDMRVSLGVKTSIPF